MNRTLKKKHRPWGQIGLNLFFILLSLCYVLPLILLISVSFEGSPSQYFSMFPREFSTAAYEMLFQNMRRIVTAYGVTIFYSVTGVALSLFVMLLFAYALSRRYFKLRNVLTFLLFFTTLFNGGLVGSYIVNATLLHLNDKIWVYILPGVVNAWNIIVIRTYLQGLSEEMFEAARLDGASELRICFNIVAPLSKPVLASVGFLRFIDAWNNWSTSQIYIRNPNLISIQYLLKQILDSIEAMTQMIENGGGYAGIKQQLANAEALRFAMAVVVAVPVLCVFPFFQKYFAKGMTIGSVKG